MRVHLVNDRPAYSLLGDALSFSQAEEADSIRRSAAWFIRMRWLAIVLISAAVLTGCWLSDILPPQSFHRLAPCLAGLAIVNIIFLLRVSRTSRPYRLIVVQAVVDLTMITLLLHFSGGIENPFFLFYLLHIIIAGIVLSRKDAMAITFLAGALFLGLVSLEAFRVLTHFGIGLFSHGGRAAGVAYDPFFVTAWAISFLLVLGMTCYFTILLRDQIRQHAANALQGGKLAAVGELAGRIAHEINNPIGIIRTTAQLLLEDKSLSPRVASVFEKIDRHSRRVAELTQGLLTYSRPSLGEKHPLDLNATIEETLYLAESRFSGSEIRLEKDLAPSLPQIPASRNEIQQILLNLINNAVDAMPQGGVLKIETGSEEGGDHVVLSITDTGLGISRHVLNRIFDPFFTTKEEGKGTGLGLSITHGLVRSHGGTIEVCSEEAKGTTFLIRFPVPPVEERQDGRI